MTAAVKRRSLRLAVLAVAVVVVLAAAGVAALPAIVRRVAAWQLAATTGRAVTIDAIELGLLRGRVTVRGVRVIDHDGAALATLGRLDARFRPLDALRGRVRLVEGVLDGLTVRIVRTGPREFNISDLLARKAEPRAGPGITTTIDRFAARNVAVDVEDRTVSPARAWRVALAADVEGVSTRPEHPPGVATLRGTVAGAPLAVTLSEVRLTPPRARGTLSLRGLDASLAALALPSAEQVRVARGSIDVAATIEPDGTTGARAALDVEITGIELERYHTAFLTAPAVRVQVRELRLRPGAVEVEQVAVDGGRVTLADAQLGTGRRWQVDDVVFEARGLSSARDAPPGTATASATMVGARVSLWGSRVRLAPLELHATTIIRNVDLAVLRASLPPALPVQPERGTVNATLVIEHDGAHGTRLGLDARLGDIELTRPAHVVTAPALHVVAEDVVLDGGAVVVGRVTAGGDRLTLEERSARPVRTWLVQNLAVEAKDLSTRPGDVQGVAALHATVAGASLSAFVTRARLDPLELEATAVARNLDVALLRLYLPSEARVELVRGTANATVRVAHTAAEGTRLTGDATVTGVEARGRWELSTMSVTAPSLRVTLVDVRRHGTALSVGRAEVTGVGRFSDARAKDAPIDIAQVRLSTEGLTWPAQSPARVGLSARFGDRGELDATGTAMLTAPLPRIEWTADLALAVRRVDLAPLGAYVPAARGLGGRVRATLTATVAYAGALTARIRGDVAGGRFALADGARTVLALRRIDATGLDVQWPDRIAIAQVRLREPSAVVERDRAGRFVVLDRFAAATPADTAPAPGPARPSLPPVAIAEVVVERGSAVVLDARAGTPARIELPRIDLTAREVAWPARAPARITLEAGLPGGGSAKVEGTVVGEPASVDVKVALADADLAVIQPLLPFRAVVRGRVDATLALAGPLSPAPRVSVRGDAAVRAISIGDGTRRLISVAGIDVAGLDGVWPERVAIDHVRVRRSWARLERDPQGGFPLQQLFVRTPAPSSGSPAPAGAEPAGTGVALSVREVILEQQAATIVDAITTPPARFNVAGAKLTVHDLTWPPRGPVKAELASPMPGGGRLTGTGTIELSPFHLDGRVALDAVAIAPVQPYLPIEGKVTGEVTGEVTVAIGLEPRATVEVTGQARLQRFQLADGDRPVVTVGRVDVAGVDVDWPRRIAAASVQLRWPRLLVERDAGGDIRLWRVAIPKWGTAPAADGGAAAPGPDATPASRAAPVIEVATLRLERASARFVDQSTTPAYAEELTRVEVTMTPLTTAPERRTRFTASGTVGGGTFKAQGEAASDATHVDLTVDVRDFVVPRANPYLDLYTGWTATRGSLSVTGAYTLTGTRVETRHDVVVRDLDVVPVDTRDEVQHRVGLPFGLLVSLLKDSRGVIKLSVPVAGDLARREFDFQEAMWSAVRALALRLVALPFSRIGSLFVSEDSKVEAVAITPVTFDPGTGRLAAGMEAHLQKVAGFLRDAPAVTLALQAVFTQADADALKAAADPTDALRALGEARLGAVREALQRAGVDAARLQGRVPRRPLVEGAGASRVELNPRPPAVDGAAGQG